MLVQGITVRNRSEYQQTIRDIGVPGGVLRVDPGQTATLHRDVYRRVAGRISSWAVNVRFEQPDPVAEPETPAEAEALAEEGAACADAPVWTHTYADARAYVIAEHGDRVNVAVEGGRNRSMLRSTWEADATPIIAPAEEPPTAENPTSEEVLPDADQT